MKTITHFDIESTGISITKDRIIQLSMIKTDLELNILDKKKRLFNNDGVAIHPDALNAHGISEEAIKNEKPFSSYAISVFNYINDCDFLCGYNIKDFDVPFLHEEFSRSNIDWIPKPIIDPCVIFKKRQPRTLSGAYKFFCGKELEGAHDAENDVLATIEVLKGQIFKYDLDSIFSENEIYPISLEDSLVMESLYENDKNKLDFAGKIILNSDGIAIYNFGKYKGMNFPVVGDLPYAGWILGAGDFSANTKNVVRSLIS